MPTREKRLRLEANRRKREQEAQVAPPPAAPPVPPAARKERFMADDGPRVWVRFTIPGLNVLTYRGQHYDRGELLTLTGGPRDEQLERLGYVQPAPASEAHLRASCGVCERWFLTERFRDEHGKLRHARRFADDLDIAVGMDGPAGGTALRDTTGDADERRMQQEYPLYLERTRATLESGSA